MDLKDKKIGFAFTGSFCTLMQFFNEMVRLKEKVRSIVPIFSYSVSEYDTRFVKAEDFLRMVTEAAGRAPIKTISEAEPIGPKKILDALIIAPCTGNTLAKLTNGITDTPVLMAAKAQLRNGGPVVIAVSTNDALGANGQNIGQLMNRPGIFLVPVRQDDPIGKPNSLVADAGLILPTLEKAFDNEQINPIFI